LLLLRCTSRVEKENRERRRRRHLYYLVAAVVVVTKCTPYSRPHLLPNHLSRPDEVHFREDLFCWHHHHHHHHHHHRRLTERRQK
jgi:hypothetical protein